MFLQQVDKIPFILNKSKKKISQQNICQECVDMTNVP